MGQFIKIYDEVSENTYILNKWQIVSAYKEKFNSVCIVIVVRNQPGRAYTKHYVAMELDDFFKLINEG